MITTKNYTQDEIDYLKENYSTLTTRDLSIKLNKTESSIRHKVRSLGLIKQPHKPWTDEEIQYLKDNYIGKTSKEIGDFLGRSVNSINAKRDEYSLFRDKPWSTDEVDYIVRNFETMTHAAMGKILSRTEQAVRAKCFDLNLYKKELPWSEYEINFVKEHYMEMRTSDISKILNRTSSAVEIKAGRMGLKKSPYTCNYHYFDNIDSEDKAYWLGFLAADGWISRNEKSRSSVVGVELQYKDINHLRKFNKSIKGNYRITDRWKVCSLSKNTDKKNHQCAIRIFSSIMYNSLLNKGFTNTKTYDFYIPEIREDLIRHYIRGYFDGDGCFIFTNKSFGIYLLTASKRFDEDISKLLEENNYHICKSSYLSDYNTLMYKINLYYLQDKLRFLDWIYKDCNIYLDRKYKKYLKVKNKYEHAQSLAV